MKVMSRFLTIAMVSLMLISINSFAQNGNGQGKGQNMGKADCSGIENKIPDLTDKQKADIERIHLDGKKEMLPITNSLKVKRAELQTLRSSEKIDQKAIDAKVKEIGDLRTQMMTLRENRIQKIRNLLTDDQKIVFDSNKSKGYNGHKGHGQKANCEHHKGNCNGCKH